MDVGADAIIVHDVRDRQSLGVRCGGTAVDGVDAVHRSAALQAAGRIIALHDAGVGLLFGAATRRNGLGTIAAPERCVDCGRCRGSVGNDHHRVAGRRSPFADRIGTAITTRVADSAEPDVLSLETRVACAAVALLPAAGESFGAPAIRRLHPCLAWWSSRHCVSGAGDARRYWWRGGGHMCCSFCRFRD